MAPRVLLIYPPVDGSAGPPSPGNDDDRYVMPYGLLTMAAELRAAGFEAGVLNLASCSCDQAMDAVGRRPAEFVGISCYTFHRHAAAALGTRIKSAFPQCHLAAGGPHVSALALPWMEHYDAFDSVVIGEGEATVVELLRRLAGKEDLAGLTGAAVRSNGQVTLGPPRPFLGELDALGQPWRHFDYGFVITSRGCPGDCTFCSSPSLWGRKMRFRSSENVLDELEELVRSRGHRFLNVKDDTFTAHKKRVLEICRGIEERDLVFRWCCDTRVDLVSEEVLTAMRRAGCVRVNLGIESGSPEIVRNINKRIDLDEAVRVTAMARGLGLDVRYYLILGSRGETPRTVYQTLEFIERARPTHYLMYGLTIYPGTADFRLATERGLLSPEDYFTSHGGDDCFNLGEESPEMRLVLGRVMDRLGRREQVQEPLSIGEREAVLAGHPQALRNHTDLALDHAGQWCLEEAEAIIRSALARFCSAGAQAELLHHLACIKIARWELDDARADLLRAEELVAKDTLRQWNQTLLEQADREESFSHYGHARAEVAKTLFANLRRPTFLFSSHANRQLTVAGRGRCG